MNYNYELLNKMDFGEIIRLSNIEVQYMNHDQNPNDPCAWYCTRDRDGVFFSTCEIDEVLEYNTEARIIDSVLEIIEEKNKKLINDFVNIIFKHADLKQLEAYIEMLSKHIESP